MAKTSKTMSDFLRATKQFPQKQVYVPYSLYGTPTIAYDESIYKHSFRDIAGTLPTTVKLYAVIARAAEMFRVDETLQPWSSVSRAGFDYQMVSKAIAVKDSSGKTVKTKAYLVELLYQDGTGFVVEKKHNEIRVSAMDDDGTNNPIPEFKALTEEQMAAIWLSCIPEILEADLKQGGGRLGDMMNTFAGFIKEYPTWHTEADVPELAKEAAFYITDAMFCYASNIAEWSFADAATASAAEQVPTAVTDKGMTGSLVVTSNPNVAFHYAVSNGSKDGGSGNIMTIGELKKEMEPLMSHRRWSKAEQMMIPYFRDDEPVMEETIRFARRILGTWNAVNPVKNLMWRGVTSYGKSTGVRQLACCLNMPLMIITCYPSMDIMDLKSNLVPDTDDDGLEVDASAITLKEEEQGMYPELQMAVDYISTLEQEERKALLSGSGFFMEAMMDSAGAAYSLFGKEMEIETDELCKIYTDAVCYFREKPLRVKIAQLETDEPAQTPKEDHKPGFKHILSAYMKALINGYMCEIQEASRIRDSGVLVGTNDYEKEGATIHLMNGAMARRHKDAIVIITDNVGYASCRPIDPSVLRRQGMIIDSYELSEQLLKDRTRRNTGCTDTALMDKCYKAWLLVKEFCDTNSITEGSVSAMELERLVQAVMLDGEDAFEQDLQDCVISKATSSIEDQQSIRSALSAVM